MTRRHALRVLRLRADQDDPDGELPELAAIYRGRGLDDDLAKQVAQALTARDPVAARVRDEIGLEDDRRARALQAAGSPAAAFSVGAVPPLLAASVIAPDDRPGVRC